MTYTTTRRHGTYSAYSAGCRCEECREAKRLHVKRWKHRTGYVERRGPTHPALVPAARAARHIEALIASGWTQMAILRELGSGRSWYVRGILRGEIEQIGREREAAILSLEPLVPVLVDEVLVDRFVDGNVPWDRLSRRERIEAARRMDRAGVSRKEIARRTHLNTRSLYGEAFTQEVA